MARLYREDEFSVSEAAAHASVLFLEHVELLAISGADYAANTA